LFEFFMGVVKIRLHLKYYTNIYEIASYFFISILIRILSINLSAL